MKRILLLSMLSILALHNTCAQAFSIKAALAATGLVGVGVASKFALRRHEQLKIKRAEWVDNFVVLPLSQIVARPLSQKNSLNELDLCVEETKRILTLNERLKVIALFVNRAAAFYSLSQMQKKGLITLPNAQGIVCKGLIMLLRAQEIACKALTQEDEHLVGFVASIKMTLPYLSKLYTENDEDAFDACLKQLRQALACAQKESASVSYYMKLKGKQAYSAIKRTVTRLTQRTSGKPSALFA